MIAKFSGKCIYCLEAITPGADEYDYESKQCWHPACKENADSQPDPKQQALAAQLGFIAFDTNLPADGLLRNMRPRDRG